MNKEEILSGIAKLIRQLFNDDTLLISSETSSADVDGWDSFEHINLLVSIEYTFHVRFDMTEVMKAKNVGELADLVFKMTNDRG